MFGKDKTKGKKNKDTNLENKADEQLNTQENVEASSPCEQSDKAADAFEDWDTGAEEKIEAVTTETTNTVKIDATEKITENTLQKDMVLYVIIDKDIPGLVRYMTESGIKVSGLYNSITEVKNAVLMQSEPTRIVVIDTGLGKFTTTKMREELIDMLGISDEQNKTTVFYTDSVLKMDTNKALGKSGKSIEWIKYTTTSVVIATILNYNETYKYDTQAEDSLIETEDSVMKFKGLTTKVNEVPRHTISGFSSEAIQTHMLSSTGEDLQGFKVNL